MATKGFVYLGPATTMNGETVPKGGLKVKMTDAEVGALIQRGHVFEGKDGDILRTKDLRDAPAAPAAPVTP